MSRQKLDLLQLTSSRVAEPSARSSEVVRRQFSNSNFRREFLHHMPNSLLSQAFSPNSACPVDSPEQPPTADTGCSEPIIQHSSDPAGQRDRADVARFADQIHDGPVLLSLLKVVELSTRRLRVFVIRMRGERTREHDHVYL